MTRNEILTEVYNSELFRGFAASYHPTLTDEIISELVTRYAEMSEDKLLKIYDNNINYYSLRVIRNMSINRYDSFYKDYVASSTVELQDYHYEIEDEPTKDIEADKFLKDIKKFLSKRSKNIKGEWANEKLFDLYFMTDDTMRDVSRDTGITLSSVHYKSKNIQNIIKIKFDDRYNRK